MACKGCEERRRLLKNAIKSKIMMLKMKKAGITGGNDEHFREHTKGKAKPIQ